ncbi:MAG TPA: TrmH family RNA methyltransferase [Aliidongia sp.]|nr:TrmH family RNA methyltransferase [Aliidongia sp.]
MRLALYQPDIAQNAGALLRLAACLALPVDLIEPLGFVFGDARLRRAGMDYLDHVEITRHSGWESFRAKLPGRLVLLTTKASVRHVDAAFQPDDTLVVGRESAGVPEDVHAAADLRVRIPMQAGLRSLNVTLAAAIVLGEALRQTAGWPVGDET